jgi:RCC1 and BTB domain-containing protein
MAKKIKMISCIYAHSMALTENGYVYTWGYNELGQLGIGNLENTYTPKRVSFESDNKEEILI